MKTSYEILDDAALLILTEGWRPDGMGMLDGAACCGHAITRSSNEDRATQEAFRAVMKVVGPSYANIPHWNDALPIDKGQDIVLKVLAQAAHNERVRMGNIGEPVREVEFEPLTEPAQPIVEPAAPTPVEEPVPA